MTGSNPGRVSSFRNLRINACLPASRSLSQATTSFVASRCQDIHRAPLVARPHLSITVTKHSSKPKICIRGFNAASPSGGMGREAFTRLRSTTDHLRQKGARRSVLLRDSRGDNKFPGQLAASRIANLLSSTLNLIFTCQRTAATRGLRPKSRPAKRG